MTEDILQYIWKTQSFDKSQLNAVFGRPLIILKQGLLNDDSGPDFSSAKIVIENIEWVGDVEVHVNSSEWYAHAHHQDIAYNKVILHVVWTDNRKTLRSDKSDVPTLELNKLVSKEWFRKYEDLQKSFQTIPCEPFFHEVDEIHKLGTFNQVLIERLQRKSVSVLNDLNQFNGDWEQTATHLLFECFGFKKNSVAFKQLATLTDYKVLAKLNSVMQLEAYLFGMGGFLTSNNYKSQYKEELRKEFNWLRKKYDIKSTPLPTTWWKFMRLRPANFPTLRIAQLASFLFHRKHFFRSIIDGSVNSAPPFFKVKQSEFWLRHYHFGKTVAKQLKGIGDASARLLSVNVGAVLLVAYGMYTDDKRYIEKAISFLEHQKPEDNSIIKVWENLGVTLTNSADTQGAIELFNNYCRTRKCLHCNIGSNILQRI